MNWARRSSTTSSTPPNSPALTMLTNSLLNTLECWAKPSEKVPPPSITSDNSPSTRRSVGFFSCLSSTLSPLSRGNPADVNWANWRVKMVRFFSLTLPLKPGIFISTSPSPFLAPFLPLGAPRLALAFLEPSFLTGSTLMGAKPISCRRAKASAWSATFNSPFSVFPLLAFSASYWKVAIYASCSFTCSGAPLPRSYHHRECRASHLVS